jgi:FkbM family methyltransferase
MSPDEFVEALYELCLGRSPDPAGLAAWTAELRATRDPIAILAGMLSSPEAQLRRRVTESPEPLPSTDLTAGALAGLKRRPRVVDVGAQSLGDGTHPYSRLAEVTPTDIVGFDPLEDRLNERRASEDVEGSIELLPFAIGDGATHTLHVNNFDATSSLFPLNAHHNADFNGLSSLETVRTEDVQTHRLDDVLPPGPIDFLKLDVQGAELMVLRGAERSVAISAVVHCEVEFAPIYEGQALYPEIHSELAQHEFALIDLIVTDRFHYLTKAGHSTPDRLLWADAVFFRETDDAETLTMQALIAATVYAKPSLAEHLLERAGLR